MFNKKEMLLTCRKKTRRRKKKSRMSHNNFTYLVFISINKSIKMTCTKNNFFIFVSSSFHLEPIMRKRRSNEWTKIENFSLPLCLIASLNFISLTHSLTLRHFFWFYINLNLPKAEECEHKIPFNICTSCCCRVRLVNQISIHEIPSSKKCKKKRQ